MILTVELRETSEKPEIAVNLRDGKLKLAILLLPRIFLVGIIKKNVILYKEGSGIEYNLQHTNKQFRLWVHLKVLLF